MINDHLCFVTDTEIALKFPSFLLNFLSAISVFLSSKIITKCFNWLYPFKWIALGLPYVDVSVVLGTFDSMITLICLLILWILASAFGCIYLDMFTGTCIWAEVFHFQEFFCSVRTWSVKWSCSKYAVIVLSFLLVHFRHRHICLMFQCFGYISFSDKIS